MGKQNCSLEGCYAPDALCMLTASPNYQQCTHFNKSITHSTVGKPEKKGVKSIPWSGQALQPSQIEFLSHRSTPKIIGLVGSSGAGKTTYLAMLYTLLFNGRKIDGWNFAGSYTLAEWELQAKSLQIKNDGTVKYPDATSSAPDFYSLYHLALRNKEVLHDVLFADSSGEVFSKWAMNIEDSGAENARWIYEHSHAFILFIDCNAIIEKRGIAKKDITQLAEQINSDLQNRPVLILWSKGDLADQMRPNIREAIESSLSTLFPDSLSLQISNYSKSESDELCHINNLKAVQSLLDSLSASKSLIITPKIEPVNDFFFQYKGSYDN